MPFVERVSISLFSGIIEVMVEKEKVEKILAEFKSKVTEILGENFERLILFGSYARGEAGKGSDIDLIIVVKHRPDPGILREIRRIANAISLKNDVVISEFIFTEDEIKRRTPLFLNVRKEGIII